MEEVLKAKDEQINKLIEQNSILLNIIDRLTNENNRG